MKEHGFPPGTYRFCYNGSILKSDRPFLNIQDGSRIYLAIKRDSHTDLGTKSRNAIPVKIEQRKPPIASTLTPPPPMCSPPSSPPNIITDKLKVSQIKETPADPIPLQKNDTKNILDTLKRLNISKVYSENSNFWANPEKSGEFIKSLSGNFDYLLIPDHYLSEHYSMAMVSGTVIPQNVYVLSGLPLPKFQDIRDDTWPLYLALTTDQKNEFKKVLDKGYTITQAINLFINSNYNSESTLSALKFH